jgi:NTP pyrophosphatase (non-canonical NTP hydrolase)
MDEMTISEYQNRIDAWVRTHGVRYFSELTNLGILMEEVGEAASLMTRLYGDQSFKKEEERLDLGDELADILFVVGCIANQTGIRLEDAIVENFRKKTRRDAQRHHRNPKLRDG